MMCLESSAKSEKDSPVLALNGAEHILQVLIGNQKEVLFYQKMVAPRQGMKFLPITIKMALDSLNLKLKDLKGIACVNGPGYFTGLRVVLSIAIGMFCASNIPLASLNYLHLIAKTAISLGNGLISSDVNAIWVLTYAKKDMVNLQGFSLPNLDPLSDPKCLFLEESLKLITASSKNPLLIGSGLRRFWDFWKQNLNFHFLSPNFDFPSKEILWKESLFANFTRKPIHPLYLRSSDAEQNLEKIKSQRGLVNGAIS